MVDRLFALAPLASPPVVPRILSDPPDSAGLRKMLPASITMDFALMIALVPTSNKTFVSTSFFRSAPAPASKPPANVRILPFNVAVPGRVSGECSGQIDGGRTAD